MSEKTGAASQCFGPVIVSLVHLEIFSILRNKLIGYADYSTLLSVVPSPGVRVAVEEFLNRDLGKVIEWCDLGDEIECQ